MRDLDKDALQAKEKKASFGQDIDLDAYESEAVAHEYVEDLEALPVADKTRMIMVGIDAREKERSGTHPTPSPQVWTG
jgi:hypothetical protein